MYALGATPVDAVLHAGGWIRPLMLESRTSSEGWIASLLSQWTVHSEH